MSRFYVPKEAVKGSLISMSGKEARHMIDVMRLKTLDRVVTFDGTGREYVGFIKEIKGKSAVIEITETKAPADRGSSKITLIQAIPKKNRMDYIVEKSTELGVSSILPSITARTIPDWDESRKVSSVERWGRIAMEASKQCGRFDIPKISQIRYFLDIIADISGYDLTLIAALDDRAVRLKDALKEFDGGSIAIAIGPEGDFTPNEVKEAEMRGFKLINLGPWVLKSDTAGLFTLAVLSYELTS